MTDANLETSLFLNASAESFKRYGLKTTDCLNVESIAHELGYDTKAIAQLMPALNKVLAVHWVAGSGLMPLHQWWTWWSEDEAVQEAIENTGPDKSHELGGCLMAVYPRLPAIRVTVDEFLAASGIKPTKQITWKDFLAN